MNYAYYPGCVTKHSAVELDVATRLVCERLGIGLRELTAAPCCGAGDLQAIDEPLTAALNAMTLAQAENTGWDVLTVCNVCTLNLRQTAALLAEDQAVRSRADAALNAAGLAYRGRSSVTHLLWVLWQELGNDRLAQAVTHRLSGITVAPFYGCQLLRPSSLNGEDDPDRPVALEDLVEACGAEAVDYDGRLKCCGWPIGAARDTTSRALAARVVLNAADAGADVIVTPCPLCHSALEGCQRGAEKLVGVPLRLPVLHLPQLVGLALGLSPRQLEMRRHLIDPGAVLARLGLSYA